MEKELVLDGLELNYEGIFDLNSLLRTIDQLIAERGYSKKEKIREEIVKPTGKMFSLELRPIKAMTGFEALIIKMRISIANLQEVDIVVDNAKRKAQSGRINIIFDAYTNTDYEKRWEQKPWFWLLRGFFEKIFFKVHTSKHHAALIEDTHHIYNNVKAHLNLHRFILKQRK